MKSLRIVFMGTPEFAVESLKQLTLSSHQVVGVVTVADKPAGRGQVLQSSAVKKFAVEHNIPVMQPIRLKDPEFLNELKSFDADLFVVVAFRMLPELVWNMPPLGTINLHGSLLPAYRGAAPINWAVINGEKVTGVTTFFLQQEIDTGNVILQTEIPIAEDDTAGKLHDRMMVIGAKTLVETVNLIAEGNAVEKPQSTLSTGNMEIPIAPKIFKDDCKIDRQKNLKQIDCFVRGLSPYPAAWTTLEGKTIRVYAGLQEKFAITGDKEWETDGKNYLKFRAVDGWYNITDLQLEGKKRMSVEEFLRGWRPGTLTA